MSTTHDGRLVAVSRPGFADVGEKPFWSTNGPGVDSCWVSVSGEDRAVVIDCATAGVLALLPVGDHPQRVREGVVADDVLET